MSLYGRTNEYFLGEDDPNDPPTRRQDNRYRVRIPAKVVFGLGKSAWLLATYSWTNAFLPLIPVALAVSARSDDDGAQSFWLNYLALIGAFGLFRYGSEELSIQMLRRLGRTWDLTVGAFSLDFEVRMIERKRMRAAGRSISDEPPSKIAVIALSRGHLELVKAYVVGKIVATTLLTLGICFILAGICRSESHFNETAATTQTSLLVTAIVPFGILAVFPSGFDDDVDSAPVLTFSRAASFVLLVLYLLYQLFWVTHYRTYSAEEDHQYGDRGNIRSGRLDWPVAIGVMVAAAVVAYYCSLPMLAALEGPAVPPGIFLGFCLLPVLAEVVEISHFVHIVFDDRMDNAMVAAAGTSVQTALCIAPILCFLGWALDQPMSLSLNLLEVVSFGVSAWIFSYSVQDGKSNYLEGIMCLGLYLIQAGAFFLFARR